MRLKFCSYFIDDPSISNGTAQYSHSSKDERKFFN